jgi:hypothetical protein
MNLIADKIRTFQNIDIKSPDLAKNDFIVNQIANSERERVTD